MQTLQIGNEWFTERAGGLNSYYSALLAHLGSTGTTAHGLVLGGDHVRASTDGQVVAFAGRGDSLPKRMLCARRAALDHLKSNHIDLIASHFALYAAPIIDHLGSKPHVVHFHGPWAQESNVEGASRLALWFKATLERSVYSRSQRLIVLSRAFERELVGRYGISSDRIRIVAGGVDTERFNVQLSRSEARQRLGWPTDRPIILSVRRQVHRMGLEALIDAAGHIVLKCPDVLILLGGKGPISGDLEKRIVELGLARHVKRLGHIEDADLPLAYRASNMTVVPSQSLEGFGLITLESLASGTPTYVTPVGGLPEIVMPFSSECVFANSSAKEMANVLIEALQSQRPIPSDEACRAYALDHFSWQHIAKQVRSVYDEAVL